MPYFDEENQKYFYYKIENRQITKIYLTDDEYILFIELKKSPLLKKFVLYYCRTKRIYKFIIKSDFLYYKIINYMLCFLIFIFFNIIKNHF